MELKLNEKVKNIVFVTEGGLGKVIASTGVVAKLKAAHPEMKLVVVAGFPEIFLHNPNVHRCFEFNNPLNFYEDWITPESHVIKVEPYTHYDYMQGQEHLLKVWGEMCGVDCTDARPEVFFMKNELEAGELYIRKLTTKDKNKKRKFVLFQWCGGLVPKDVDPMSWHDAKLNMHRRSLPLKTAKEIVNRLISAGYEVGCVQHENFPLPEGAHLINFNARGTLCLLKHSNHFIGIDSFLHHGAAALGVRGVTVWGGTNPKKLGYAEHVNLSQERCKTPFCHRPDSYVFDGNPKTGLWNCPYNEECLDWKAEEIVKAYLDLEKEEAKKP
jgi:hypothetical protein